MPNKNQPAFPSGESYRITDLAGNTRSCSKGPFHLGISVRAYIAAKFMQAELSRCCVDDFKWLAKRCVELADALIAELDSGEA